MIICQVSGEIQSSLNHNRLAVITPASKHVKAVMPDLIRHPVQFWIPAFAGMTKKKQGMAALTYIVAGVISRSNKKGWLLSRGTAFADSR